MSVKNPCRGCIYFKVCGENTRTKPCDGRETKSQTEKVVYNNFHGIRFTAGRFTPRNNEYEKGLKYFLIVNGNNTDYRFSSIPEVRKWIKENYFIFL